MLLDFDDYRPETPRITSPITVREGVLLSLVVHLAFVIFLLLAPDSLFEPSSEQVAALEPQQQEPLRFVEATPLRELPTPPVQRDLQSDLDRRAATRERAPVPENPDPVSRGNTPERVVGGPTERALAAGSPTPPAPPEPEQPETPPLPQQSERAIPQPSVERPRTPVASMPPGNRGSAFQNLEQYLRNDNFSNPNGGQAEQSADIQFDSMGVDFGPWLLRFKHQVERNWTVPAAVEAYRGRVVIRFGVLRNGTIVNLEVLSPGPIPALTQSALSALKLSNPTAPLPQEYPVEPAVITVTFYFNEFPEYRR